MIILKIHIYNIALMALFEAKRKSPIPANRHSEGSSSISAQRVKATGPAQIAKAGCGIYGVEEQAHVLMELGTYPPRPPL